MLGIGTKHTTVPLGEDPPLTKPFLASKTQETVPTPPSEPVNLHPYSNLPEAETHYMTPDQAREYEKDKMEKPQTLQQMLGKVREFTVMLELNGGLRMPNLDNLFDELKDMVLTELRSLSDFSSAAELSELQLVKFPVSGNIDEQIFGPDKANKLNQETVDGIKGFRSDRVEPNLTSTHIDTLMKELGVSWDQRDKYHYILTQIDNLFPPKEKTYMMSVIEMRNVSEMAGIINSSSNKKDLYTAALGLKYSTARLAMNVAMMKNLVLVIDSSMSTLERLKSIFRSNNELQKMWDRANMPITLDQLLQVIDTANKDFPAVSNKMGLAKQEKVPELPPLPRIPAQGGRAKNLKIAPSLLANLSSNRLQPTTE